MLEKSNRNKDEEFELKYTQIIHAAAKTAEDKYNKDKEQKAKRTAEWMNATRSSIRTHNGQVVFGTEANNFFKTSPA